MQKKLKLKKIEDRGFSIDNGFYHVEVKRDDEGLGIIDDTDTQERELADRDLRDELN